jgi:hypothetical protein
LPVYRRQLFPDPVLGERPADTGTTIFETDAVRLWHLGDDVGIVSFRSKANTIGEDVLEGLLRAVDEAERQCAGLVLWQSREPFSLGANLAAIAPAIAAKQWDAIEAVVAKFPPAMRLRDLPLCARCAWRSAALQFIMHADVRWPHWSHIDWSRSSACCREAWQQGAVRAAEEGRGAKPTVRSPVPFIALTPDDLPWQPRQS